MEQSVRARRPGELPAPGEGGSRQLLDVALTAHVLDRVGLVVLELHRHVVLAGRHVPRDLHGHRPGPLLVRLQLAEDELAPVEDAVVALGVCAQPVDRRGAVVVRGDRQIHGVAGLRARCAQLGGDAHLPQLLRRWREGSRRRLGRLGPVEAHRLERLADLLLLLRTALLDERLHLLELLEPVGAGGGLGEHVAAELDLVVEGHAVVVGRIVGVVLLRSLARLDRLARLALLRRLVLDEPQRLDRLLRRALARRLGLLLVARECVEEVLVVVRLAERLGRGEQVDALLQDARRHQLDVGSDADLLDRHVARSQVLRDGQLESALVARILVLEVVEDLDRPLPEALPAHDEGAVQVLERAGHDLGGARALRADQHRHGELALPSVVARQLGLAQLTVHPDGGDDGAFLDERVAHLDGLLEQPAGVPAHVEHQPAQRAAVLLLHRANGSLHVARGGPREAGEPHVADAVVEQLGGHRLVGDGGAHEVQLARVLPLVLHDDRDACAGLAAHPIHGFLQLHGDRRVGVDLGDHVTLLDPRAPRRRVLQHLPHGQPVVDHGDDEPEAAELAAGLHLHLLVEIRLEQPAVRIEGREHAVDGGVLDLALVALGDHVVADEGEDLPHLERDLPDGVDVAIVELARGAPHRHPDLALRQARVRMSAVGRRRAGGSARLAAGSLIRAGRPAHLDHHLGNLALDRLER